MYNTIDLPKRQVDRLSLFIVLLYIVVALVKLFVFHSCTIDVFLRYVRINKFIITILNNS